MAKLLNSCVVSYCRDLVVVFYGEGAAKLPEWFEPLVLPPTLLVDCRVAKSVVAYAKNLCEGLVSARGSSRSAWRGECLHARNR
jgi:hypothetical protein